MHACPEEKPYIDTTNKDNPECKPDCPTDYNKLFYLDNGLTTAS